MNQGTVFQRRRRSSHADERPDTVSGDGNSALDTSPSEERRHDHAPMAEGETNCGILPSEDPVVDTGLEVGDVPTTSAPNDGVDLNSAPAAK